VVWFVAAVCYINPSLYIVTSRSHHVYAIAVFRACSPVQLYARRLVIRSSRDVERWSAFVKVGRAPVSQHVLDCLRISGTARAVDGRRVP